MRKTYEWLLRVFGNVADALDWDPNPTPKHQLPRRRKAHSKPDRLPQEPYKRSAFRWFRELIFPGEDIDDVNRRLK